MRGYEDVLINASPDKVVVASFDQRELMVLLFEAWVEIKRPQGATVDEALATIAQREPAMHEDLRRMAWAALQYFAEGMRAAGGERLQ